MQNERFKRKKIEVNNWVLDAIASSEVMTDKEKLRFMAFVWYLTLEEQKELTEIV
jgi:hypothetical protein